MSFEVRTRGLARGRQLAHAAVLVGLAVTMVASSLAIHGGPLAAVGPSSAQITGQITAEQERAAAIEQARAARTRAAVGQAAQLALDRALTAREQASAAAVDADRLAELDAATGALRSLLDELQPEGTAGVRGGETAAARAAEPAGGTASTGDTETTASATSASPAADLDPTAADPVSSPSPTLTSFAVTSPQTVPDPVADQAGILDVATTPVDEVRAALPGPLDVEDDATAAVLVALDALAQTVAEVSGEIEVSRATAALAQTEQEQARQQAEAAAASARSRAARLATDAHSLDGYENGQVPVSALCSPAFDLTVHLRCDAAELLDSLDRAYRAQFGTDLQVTDSYRSLDAQVVCQQEKGSLCADPGTSNHGIGIAVDLGGAVRWSGTAEHTWMLEHSEEYGWVKPDWSLDTGSKPEPWHFDFAGAPG